jgi:hypothetical protein
MPSTKTVGRSERTAFKITLFRKHVGRAIGSLPFVLRKFGHDYSGIKIVDLNAGDGSAYENAPKWAWGSTIALAANIGATHPYGFVRIGGYEWDAKVFNHLLTNLTERLPELNYVKLSDTQWRHSTTGATLIVRNKDSSTEQFILRPGEGLYVMHDPNSMGTASFDARYLKLIFDRHPLRCAFFSALGFNAAGQKRLSREGRDPWFKFIESLIDIVRNRSSLDLLLTYIVNDPAQWAYLQLMPKKWGEQTREEIDKCAANAGFLVNTVSWRFNQAHFKDTIMRLINTLKELHDANMDSPSDRSALPGNE